MEIISSLIERMTNKMYVYTRDCKIYHADNIVFYSDVVKIFYRSEFNPITLLWQEVSVIRTKDEWFRLHNEYPICEND